jgi:hypothetical protein
MKKLNAVPSEEPGEERRESFRIDDDLSVVLYKLDKPETFPDPEKGVSDRDDLLTATQPVNMDSLWKLLVLLHKKLDWILERMPMDLLKIMTQPVNLSATGLRTKVKEKFEMNERVKIRMLLPTFPAKEVVLCGRVVRISPQQDGDHELALQFEDVTQEIQNEIVQHTLKQQRKTFLNQKEPKGEK